jgi:hypothetical protein
VSHTNGSVRTASGVTSARTSSDRGCGSRRATIRSVLWTASMVRFASHDSTPRGSTRVTTTERYATPIVTIPTTTQATSATATRAS